MAPRKRHGGVKNKKNKKRGSAPQPNSSTKHPASPSSPLRKGLTYGKDVFSESENDADAGGRATAAAAVGDGNDGHGKMGNTNRQQVALTSSAVAGPSRQRPKLADMTFEEMSPVDRLVSLAVQSIKQNQKSLTPPDLARLRTEAAQFYGTVSPPPTPQLDLDEFSDEELREGVEEILDLMFPGEVYPSVPLPPPTVMPSASGSGAPPVGTFQSPRDWSEVSTPAQQVVQGDTESTAAAVNLPLAGLFSPTGKTLQAHRASPSSSGTTTAGPSHRDEQAVASESSAPLPPTGIFSPPSQALRVHHHCQSPKSIQATSCRHHSDEDSRAAAVVPASSLNPPLPNVPAQKEDTKKLDLLAAVALGQFDPTPFATLGQLFQPPQPGEMFSGLYSDTANSTTHKGNKPNTIKSTSESAAMMPPPPTEGRTPTRRRGPQRRAALKSQEVSRKMTTKSEIRNLLKKNAENASTAIVTTDTTTSPSTGDAADAAGAAGAADAADVANVADAGDGGDASDGGGSGSSSSPPTDNNNPSTIDPAAGQPYTEVDIDDHAFRDIPHKDNFFPQPKAHELKKAVSTSAGTGAGVGVSGDPHDPEVVKRHTERYQKRLEMNTFQWPESNVRSAEDNEAEVEYMVGYKIPQIAREFREMTARREEARRRFEKLVATNIVDYSEKKNDDKGKGKQRATYVESEEEDDKDDEDDEAATVVDSQLTTDDDNVTVTDIVRARVEQAERDKLMHHAIAVWTKNEDIRNHYNKLDREQSQRDAARAKNLFNSRLHHAVVAGAADRDGGEAPTPPPEAQASTAGTSGNNKNNNTKSGEPSSARWGAHAHMVCPQHPMETFFAQTAAAAAAKQKSMPTPETSFNGESSSWKSFDFCMPATHQETNESGADNVGLDGAADAPNKDAKPQKQQTRPFHSILPGRPVYEEVDFEIDNPVPKLPPPPPRGAASTGNKKKAGGARGQQQSSDAPVNMTSKLGDDPFYYDPRFDPTDVYPGVLQGRYRHRRRLVAGGAEAHERIEAAKKREAEEEERKRKQHEEEMRNDPIEALLKKFMGDEYVGPQGRASASGSGSRTTAAAGGPSTFSSPAADDDDAPCDDPAKEEKSGPSGPESH